MSKAHPSTMGRRLLPMNSAAENDALTGWRRFYCYLQRAGATSSIKRAYRRRERHDREWMAWE